MLVWALLCHNCGLDCQQRVLNTFPGLSDFVNLYICLTISSCYGSIPLTIVLMGRDGGWSTLVSQFLDCLSAEGDKNVSWPWLSLLPGWGSLTITFSANFVYGSQFYLANAHSLWPSVWWLGMPIRAFFCHSCGFPCQWSVLETFPAPGYLCS